MRKFLGSKLTGGIYTRSGFLYNYIFYIFTKLF